MVGVDESWYVHRAPNSDPSDVSGLSVQCDTVPYCFPVGTPPPSDTPKQHGLSCNWSLLRLLQLHLAG